MTLDSVTNINRSIETPADLQCPKLEKTLTSCISLENLKSCFSKIDKIIRKNLKKISLLKTANKTQYVYHTRREPFQGNFILPLNSMVAKESFADIHKIQDAKYLGREYLKKIVIPPLNCLWNDVIFLSPLHPQKHFDKYKELGFSPTKREYFQIPVEVLKEKRVALWKFPILPSKHPDTYAPSQFERFDWKSYKEMSELPEETVQFYRQSFDPKEPNKYPRFNWIYIPHILCQDPIDITDKRIKLITAGS